MASGESIDVDSNEVRRQWADRSGAYSPAYYAYYGPDESSEAVRAVLERFVGRDAAVLELGCSSGRHLSHLADHGFENLAGIEVNPDAMEVMEDTYPELAARGTFYLDAIEDVVGDFEDDQFDAVFSVETLQHLHPDVEWVFAELARITDDVLVTVENEGEEDADAGGDGGTPDHEMNDDGDDPGQDAGPEVNYVENEVPLYYRDWNRIFTDLGFDEVRAESVGRDTLRAFRRQSGERDR